jgi:hypothetical protein
MLHRISAVRGRLAQALLAATLLAGTTLGIASPAAAYGPPYLPSDLAVTGLSGLDQTNPANLSTHQEADYQAVIENVTDPNSCIQVGRITRCPPNTVYGVVVQIQVPSAGGWSPAAVSGISCSANCPPALGFSCTVSPSNLVTCTGGIMPIGSVITIDVTTGRPRPGPEARNPDGTYGTETATAVVNPGHTIPEYSYTNNSVTSTGLWEVILT